MKNALLCGILVMLTCWLHAQTITGKVYRAGTDSVIAGATVYYGGSMAGTTTNNKGQFELQARQQQIPVIVSCVGYFSSTVTYKPGMPLVVYLKPKTEQLHTVTIRADGMNRDEEIRLFIREFIGISDYALSCTIVNMDDIDLFYDKKTETLTASCDKPIIIINKKLGYTITYYLDDFVKNPRTVHFAGNYIFKENKAPSAQTQAKIERNREDAYEASRMQLVRALWHHTLKQTGFRLYSLYYDKLTEDNIIVRDSLQQQYLKLPGKIIISHSSNTRNITTLNPISKFCFIDKDGYYGAGLQWAGRLTIQRMGDLLPFEYQSEKELKNWAQPDTAILTETPANAKAATAQPDKESSTAIPDNKDWKQFVSVALMPGNALNTGRVVRKWEQPIRYKIYGTYGNTGYDQNIADNIAQTFKKLEPLTGLSITNTETDSEVNLFIVIGRPAAFASILPPEAMPYFNKSPANTCYYTAAANGFTRMVVCVNAGHALLTADKDRRQQDMVQNQGALNGPEAIIVPDHLSGDHAEMPAGGMLGGVMIMPGKHLNQPASNLTDTRQLQELWCEVRLMLMKSLGFSGVIDDASSLFCDYYTQWLPRHNIAPADVRIIKTLYSLGVKSGMNEQETYQVVKEMFPPSGKMMKQDLTANNLKKDKTTEKELKQFKTAVLINDNPLDEHAVVRKWEQAINYKIYGTCGNPELDQQLSRNIASIFSFFTENAGVPANPATDDGLVNFFIILNGSPGNYTGVLPPDFNGYFKSYPESPGYYSYSENGFSTMAKFVHLEHTIGDPVAEFPLMVGLIRQHILNGLGFFKLPGSRKGSIFNSVTNFDSPDPAVQAMDSRFIKWLYQPAVRSGMTEQELDNALKDVNF